MEEKLYFAPTKYGKGNKKGDKKKFLKLACFLTFLLILGIIIFWFLHGKTTVSGNFPANIGAESLTCSKDNTAYEKAVYSGDAKTRARVTAIFDGTEKLRNLSLNYVVNTSSNSSAKNIEAILHHGFARNLSDDGYSFTEFDNKFSIIGNALDIAVYLGQNQLTEKSAPYFMLQNASAVTLADYRKAYESQGFSCASTIDNK